MSHAFPPGDAEYVLRENVPIFHEVTQHDVKGELPFTAEVIDLIAALNNERVAIGEVPVISVGHRDKMGTERPAIGFLGNFTTGIRDGVRTLFATLAVYAERADLLRSFPRRSIEVIQTGPKQHLINGLALLGASEPGLDLGVLCFNSDRPDMATFTMENDQAAEAKTEVTVPDDLKAQILQVFSQTDVFAYCHAQMKSAGEAEAQGDQEQMTEASADKSDENAEGEVGDKGGEGSEGDSGESAEKQDDSARESQGEEAAEEKKNEDDGKDFSAVEAENQALKGRVREMERRSQLVELERQGFDFSVDDELAAGSELDDRLFQSLIVDRVVKFARRAPIKKEFSVADVNNGGKTSAGVDEDRGKRAQSYARQHGCTFKEAWDKV